MKLRCLECRAKYRVDDATVARGAVRVTCKRCGAQIFVRETGAKVEGASVLEPYVAVAAALAIGGESEAATDPHVSAYTPELHFFIGHEGKTRGPYKVETVADLVRKGKLSAGTWAVPAGDDDAAWKTLADFEAFSALFPARRLKPDADLQAPIVELQAVTETATDQVPLINEEPPPPPQEKVGERTRMVLLEAGVLGREERHQKLGKSALVLGAGALLGFAIVFSLGWFYWLERPEEALEVPVRRVVVEWDASDTEGGDFAFLTGAENKTSHKKRRRKRKLKKSVTSSGTTRSDDHKAEDARAALKSHDLLAGGKERAKAPEKAKGALVEQEGGLEAKTISTVIKSNIGSISHCVESAAKSGGVPRGKQRVIIQIQNSGKVSRARVADRAINASPLGECVARTARRWRFPPFTGSAFDVVFPIVLKL